MSFPREDERSAALRPFRHYLVRFVIWLVAAFAAPGTLSPLPAQVVGTGHLPGLLRLRQLNVGQGDAALITTAEGRHILIDAGPTAHGVAEMLRKAGIDTLDLVVASHNHADHIGGMADVLFSFSVRAYLDNGIPSRTSVYRRTLSALEREPNIRYLRATSRTITLGSTSVRVLQPPGVGTQNDNSVGVIIEFGKFRALFTGDSERKELSVWLQRHQVPKVNFMKVSHHGSHNGTTRAWVRATSPSVVVISVGPGRPYGHPSSRVEAQWSAGGAHVYRTDRDGSVELTAQSNGDFTVRTFPREGQSR